ASLALLFFVIDDAHTQPIGWISCRHVLIAAAPTLLGLAAHLRFRERGFRAGRWLAPLGIAIGLLGGETALGGAALVVAYELVGPGSLAGPRPQPLARRLAAAAPTLAVVGAYLVIYRALGCGASASGAYVEPLTEPLAFVTAVAVRLPTLLAD